MSHDAGSPGQVATTRPAAAAAGERYELVAEPDDITHLVCCRDASWRRTFCGAHASQVNPAATTVCTMCVEAYELTFTDTGEPICPIDSRVCPDAAEIDRRISETTGPDR